LGLRSTSDDSANSAQNLLSLAQASQCFKSI
jgi:hypothetical protein